MFSQRVLAVAGVVLLIALSGIVLTINGQRGVSAIGSGGVGLSLIAPFQEGITGAVRNAENIWMHYFNLVNVANNNKELLQDLGEANERLHKLREVELSNERLKELLNFKRTLPGHLLAAEVIGKDPSRWFKAIIIDKGRLDGVVKGLPVVVPDGIVGQVTVSAARYSKVLLIMDQNSAVDALVQRSRARGIVKGALSGHCSFSYVLSKHDVATGDVVVSSGLDGVFPKGFRIGEVLEIVKNPAGIFQEVRVTPFPDFKKLEEVLVILNPRRHDFDK